MPLCAFSCVFFHRCTQHCEGRKFMLRGQAYYSSRVLLLCGDTLENPLFALVYLLHAACVPSLQIPSPCWMWTASTVTLVSSGARSGHSVALSSRSMPTMPGTCCSTPLSATRCPLSVWPMTRTHRTPTSAQKVKEVAHLEEE